MTRTLKRKKGVMNYDKYKWNINKNAKVRGESYINNAENEIHEKLPATKCMYVNYENNIIYYSNNNKFYFIKI